MTVANATKAGSTETTPVSTTEATAGDETVRVGVFVCHCGKNIGGVIDSAEVARYAEGLPGVVMSKDNMYTCAEPGQAEIRSAIEKYGLNRVVVAACSPKMHEPTFKRTCAEAGLNPYLFEMANIREHGSWVHMHEPEAATAKAKDLVRMAVAKVRLARPLTDRRVPVTKAAMVVGGGVAGMQAALDLADQGIPVHLIEKTPSLGGRVAHLYRTFPHYQSAGCVITPKMAKVRSHPNITLLTDSEVASVDGFIGNFDVHVRQKARHVTQSCDSCGKCAEVCPIEVPDEHQAGLVCRKAIYLPFPEAVPNRYVIDTESCNGCGACVKACPRSAVDLGEEGCDHELKIGAMVVATGSQAYDAGAAGEFGYGRLSDVVTTSTLERMLDPAGPTGGRIVRPSDGREARSVAFIQCVGSRQKEGNEYCSRICCMTSIKQARELVERDSDVDVSVYYRDIRTPKKEYERAYADARESGVLFLRGGVEDVVQTDGSLTVVAASEFLEEQTEQAVDMVVLSTGCVPDARADAVRDVLKIPVGPDGFFMETHPKLKPVETVIDGVFLAGSCLFPKDIREAIAQGSGAAGKVYGVLSKTELELDAIISHIDQELCSGCQQCIKQCPFQAIVADPLPEGDKRKVVARVIEAACKGCGVCAGACLKGAVDCRGFTDAQVYAQIDAALEEDPGGKILAFCCNWCSYAGADFAGVARYQYPPQARVVRVMCSGRISKDMVLHAFEKGAGLVLVSGCHKPGDCHYVDGNFRCEERVQSLWKTLPRRGIDPARLRLEWVSAAEGVVWARIMREMAAQLATLELSKPFTPEEPAPAPGATEGLAT
jgi:heterodisulfide reductase subunit A2